MEKNEDSTGKCSDTPLEMYTLEALENDTLLRVSNNFTETIPVNR